MSRSETRVKTLGERASHTAERSTVLSDGESVFFPAGEQPLGRRRTLQLHFHVATAGLAARNHHRISSSNPLESDGPVMETMTLRSTATS